MKLVSVQISITTIKISMEVFEKFKIKLPHDPTLALLGIYPKDSLSTTAIFAHPHSLLQYSQ